jgi:GNAT superfamily N-acetyltransferase
LPWRSPWMVMAPIGPIPPPPSSIRISRVADAAAFEDWQTAAGSGDLMRQVFPRTTLDDPAFRLVVAYVDGAPVGHAALIRTDDIAGIYAVGTQTEFRGRGIGTAVTWAAVAAGVEGGCRIAILQSSEMGLGPYLRMGFRQVCRYVAFETPETEPTPP